MTSLRLTLLFLFLSVTFAHSEIIFEDFPIADTVYGKIRGSVEKSRDGRDFYSFRGIPYGKAERFEVSVEPDKWEGIKKTDEYGPPCINRDFVIDDHITGVEDCLFINIFVPKLKKEKKLPVLFFIHGGGYRAGSSFMYPPNYFMDEDVVLVTINYRLGPFGFLNTVEGSYGNMGAKDWILALKFVQNNIENFGGNPKKVTIFGESAGGSASHHLVLSPLAKGLFNNAILHSGTANTVWSFKDPGQDTISLGKLLDCPNPQDSKELIKCLKKKDANDILKADLKLLKSFGSKGKELAFVPSLDKGRPKNETFLADAPINLLKRGEFNKVSIINGVVKDEGVFIFGAYLLNDEESLSKLNKNWEKYGPIIFSYDDLFTSKELSQVSAKIKEFYFGDEPIGKETTQAVLDLYSDMFFVMAAKETSVIHASIGNVQVFNYILNFKPDHTIFQMFKIAPEFDNYITHADELSLFFPFDQFLPPDAPAAKYSDDSILVSKEAVKSWVNFAKKGYPTSWGSSHKLWKPVGEGAASGEFPMEWFSIDVEPKMISEPFQERMDFWEELFKTHGSKLQSISKKDEL